MNASVCDVQTTKETDVLQIVSEFMALEGVSSK